MGMIETRWRFSMGRRKALASLATMIAGSPLLHAQLDPHGILAGHKRVPGLDEMMNAFDFEPICYANMTLERFDYMQHGDGSEFNLRRDRQAFDWVEIVPGKAIDPKTVDLSTQLLGIDLKYPIYVAPSSGQGALHPDGEMGMYRGATAAGAIMAIASGPSIQHSRIAAAATGPRWNQFYPIPDLDASRDALLQYQDLGTKAIIDHGRSTGLGLRARPARPESRWLSAAGPRARTGRRRRGRGARRPRRTRWAGGTPAGDGGGRGCDHAHVPHPLEVPRGEPPALVQLGLHRRGAQGHQGAAHHQGHPDARRCRRLRQGRRGRDHRVESRRPVDGLRALHARSAARDRARR